MVLFPKLKFEYDRHKCLFFINSVTYLYYILINLYIALNRGTRVVEINTCIQRVASWWECGCRIISNGLVREARNRKKVGAYGGPARYQLDAYVSMQKWVGVEIRQFGWYRRSWSFCPLVGIKAFFILYFGYTARCYDIKLIKFKRGENCDNSWL